MDERDQWALIERLSDADLAESDRDPSGAVLCFCTHPRDEHDDADGGRCKSCRRDTSDPATWRHVFDPA